MTNFRPAEIRDIQQIQSIENSYYEGFTCPKNILKFWIESASENFIIAEKNNKIVGFIFFEYLDEIKPLPFIHKKKRCNNGKYIYISEVSIIKDSDNILQELLDEVIRKARKSNCQKIIWLTGERQDHDKIERKLILKNNFKKIRNVKNWEACPNYFVSDHSLWGRKI